MQKKKIRKCILNFLINTKKQKYKKKNADCFGLFSLLDPLCIFLHFKPQNSCKQRQKCKKKQNKIFKLQKCICKKKN